MKKAFFFSIISLLLVIMFAAMLRQSLIYQIDESNLAKGRERARLINIVVTDFHDTHFDMLVETSVKKTLLDISRYHAKTHYAHMESDIDSTINKVIQTGGFRSGTDYDDNYFKAPKRKTTEYMPEKIMEDMNEYYNTIGINVSRLDIEVTRTQHPLEDTTYLGHSIKLGHPWILEVRAIVNYKFDDMYSDTSFKGSAAKTLNISVIGIRLYDFYGDFKSRCYKRKIGVNGWDIITTGGSQQPSVRERLSKTSTLGSRIVAPLDTLGLTRTAPTCLSVESDDS